MNFYAGRNKYNRQRTTIDGLTFDSKHEATRYCTLKYLERIGEIHDLRTQIAFELIPTQRGEDGKAVEKMVKYIADFTYTDKNGQFVVEDAKSPATRTDAYIIKRKLMLYLKGIQIKEV